MQQAAPGISSGAAQSADKAHNRKNCPDKNKIGGNFLLPASANLPPTVTYVHVSSLGGK